MTPASAALFDCDNHYYEAADAFTRHVPAAMQPRCVQWAQVEGRRRHVVGGRVDYSVGNPGFDPIARPGCLHAYFKGNPSGRTALEQMSGDLEPLPAAYVDRDVRLGVMDAQGVEGIWLFPTLGVLYEEPLKHDTDAVCALFEGFNRWLDEDWGYSYRGRIFAAPYLSLADVDWACRELEVVLARDARVIVMRPAAAWTRDGPRTPGDARFDPFWARVNEAGITVVVHAGNSGYATNGYGHDRFGRATIGLSSRPTVKSVNLERAAYDFLLTVAYEKLFERFPNLRLASVENGSEFMPDLLRKLGHSKARTPGHYGEDPVALFREHVFVNPFWEDDLGELVDVLGDERVIFGSDWPHMEGLPEPLGILDEVGSLDAQAQARVLRENTRSLTERRPV